MSSTTKKKFVEKETTDDFSLPNERQIILKIIKPVGNNLHQALNKNNDETLISMPRKFRNHIFIKRGDFVLAEPITEGKKVTAEIVRILTKEHIKFYKSENVWPSEFDEVIKEKEFDFMQGNPNKIKIFQESSSDSESD